MAAVVGRCYTAATLVVARSSVAGIRQQSGVTPDLLTQSMLDVRH
jgi:hypothetical protein